VSGFALRSLAAYAFLPWALPRHILFPSVRILMYHRVARLGRDDQLTVTPERFAEQAAYLASSWRVLSLAQAVAELETGGPPAPAVAITFDDGYRDNLLHALPVLRRHGLPATIFVTARFSDQTARHPRYPDEGGRLHLNWDEIRALAQEPGITIGSHTLTHPFLTRTDDSEANEEIGGSRQQIGHRLDRHVDFFCYPAGDLGERERGLVAAAGYRAAVSVRPGGNKNARDLFALRRTEVTDRDGIAELRLKLIGAFDPLHKVLHRRRERAFGRARVASARARETGNTR
jgi:peptidoglycan/xylan/chitin deacetylase (PgdA/CDA1 family)